jgi:hypothetical protein
MKVLNFNIVVLSNLNTIESTLNIITRIRHKLLPLYKLKYKDSLLLI